MNFRTGRKFPLNDRESLSGPCRLFSSRTTFRPNSSALQQGDFDSPERDTEYDYISKGEGQIWEYGYIEINGVRRAGVYITGAILDRFNKEQSVDLRFDSLRSLADAVSRDRDIPLRLLLDENDIVENSTCDVHAGPPHSIDFDVAIFPYLPLSL